MITVEEKAYAEKIGSSVYTTLSSAMILGKSSGKIVSLLYNPNVCLGCQTSVGQRIFPL